MWVLVEGIEVCPHQPIMGFEKVLSFSGPQFLCPVWEDLMSQSPDILMSEESTRMRARVHMQPNSTHMHGRLAGFACVTVGAGHPYRSCLERGSVPLYLWGSLPLVFGDFVQMPAPPEGPSQANLHLKKGLVICLLTWL